MLVVPSSPATTSAVATEEGMLSSSEEEDMAALVQLLSFTAEILHNSISKSVYNSVEV